MAKINHLERTQLKRFIFNRLNSDIDKQTFINQIDDFIDSSLNYDENKTELLTMFHTYIDLSLKAPNGYNAEMKEQLKDNNTKAVWKAIKTSFKHKKPIDNASLIRCGYLD